MWCSARTSEHHFFHASLKTFVWLCLLPLAVVVLAFFVLPMARLMIAGASGPLGLVAYAGDPHRAALPRDA